MIFFVFIMCLWVEFVGWGWSIQPSASGNEVDQDHDNRDDKQDVNEAAHCVTAHETKQPEDEKNERNSV